MSKLCKPAISALLLVAAFGFAGCKAPPKSTTTTNSQTTTTDDTGDKTHSSSSETTTNNADGTQSVHRSDTTDHTTPKSTNAPSSK